jgi:hypothetical protein
VFCGTEGAGRRLYRAAERPRRAGLGHRAGEAMPRPDSGASPSLAQA